MIHMITAQEKKEDQEEYAALLAIFKRFLEESVGKTKDELLESMMDLRSEFLINHALKGFGLDLDKALDLLKSHNNGLTKQEREQRNILVAAIENLVDFAVAEEFQMSNHLPDEEDMAYEDWLNGCVDVFDRYNDVYASVENGDVEYAMGVAAWWVMKSEMTLITYMTQGDDRVRPWHRALEGLSYPKIVFPDWMIPPIEHGCRCYLIEESVDGAAGANSVEASLEVPEMPDFVNPVFKESVAKCGRIFGPAHSYFSIPKGHKRQLKKIAKKIKAKWLE